MQAKIKIFQKNVEFRSYTIWKVQAWISTSRRSLSDSITEEINWVEFLSIFALSAMSLACTTPEKVGARGWVDNKRLVRKMITSAL